MTTARDKKFVLVTGCSEGGLGHALAKAFVAEGCHVFATVRDTAKATSLANDGNVTILPLEVTSPESIKACLTGVRQATEGRLDILVNNAGVGLVMPLLDTSIDEARRLFDVNVWGMLAVTQAFAPLLLQARGAILNISSIAGAVRMAWQGAYNSSKASVTFLSETLRIELEPLGIRVMTAMVGEVDTGFYTHVTFCLPEGSHYKRVQEFVRKQSFGELQTNNEPARVTARNLARDVLSGRQGQVWRGGVAGTAKYASWLLPARLFEWFLHSGRGISQLRREVVDGE
ncbi:hypothetical protein F4680DRAFT_19764 [Xylaria scruposa]|nr:hypothetical protein F4680DRAFT_19764 [Xylaria scruposa]